MNYKALKRPRGRNPYAAWSFYFLLLASFFLPKASFASDNHIDSLISQAAEKKLHETRQWQVLLHYKPKLMGGYESLIDDPLFFNSPQGKYDPQKELEETLRSFFKEDSLDDKHPQCRFIARFNWLKKELGMDETRLHRAQCAEYEKAMETINPESAVLIFPVAYLNSPASMFGHTLLRIDSASESKMLSYAVNYSAMTSETNGILFAFKGIFGYYKGFYSVLPYYEKIKEYSHIDNRDMWEYDLGFTEEEVRDMMMHLWELKDIYSYYYFFDENCSYNLLFLLESGRPHFNLTDKVPFYVIPVDTLRAVEASNLLGGEPFYRYSKSARIRHIASKLDDNEKKLALDMARGAKEPSKAIEGLADEKKVLVLDLSAEYIQYSYAKHKIGKKDYTKSLMGILGERSKLGKGSEYEIAAPLPPEKGHGTARLGFGLGAKKADTYETIKFRPANHSLLDPDEGYVQGAAISFLDFELRYYNQDKKLSLEELTFIEIFSISGRDMLFKPVSWKVTTGFFREEFEEDRYRTVFRLNTGGGVAYEVVENGFLYAFLEPEIKAGGDLDDDFSIGAGVSIGALTPITSNWKAQAQLRAVRFFYGDEHSSIKAELNNRFTLDARNAVMVGLEMERLGDFRSSGINVFWNHYF